MPKCEKCKVDYADEDVHVCEVKDPKIKDDSADLKELVGDMPPKVQDAIEAAHKKEEEVKEAQAQAIDRAGHKFDPNIHATDEKGNPKFTPKTGKFLKKKLNIPKNGQATQSIPPQPQIDLIAQEAKEWTVLVITLTAAFVAEEAEPTPNEFERMKIGFEGVFRKYGVPSMGCEMVLVSATIAYMMPRLANPKKPTGLYIGVKNWIIRLFPKKKEEKKEDKKP